MSSEIEFHEGETVLIDMGDFFYEAKILKFAIQEGVPKYFVHYYGWNTSKHDWVESSKIEKYKSRERHCVTSENPHMKSPHSKNAITKENKLKQTRKKRKRKEVGNSCITENFVNTSTQTDDCQLLTNAKLEKKTKVDEDLPKPENIELPNNLTSILFTDWITLTYGKKLIKLPTEVTVDQIIDDYLKEKTKDLNLLNYEVKDMTYVIKSLSVIFNKHLKNLLLFKVENQQYHNILKRYKTKKPSEIYGSIHLLRMIVIFDKLVESITMNKLQKLHIFEILMDFVKYLSTNEKLFREINYFLPRKA